MKFSCSKSALDKQLQYVSRVITVRQSVPILSNLLLETDRNILRITGTDLELTITTYLPATITQEGAFTVPAKLLQEFVHQNPDEELHFSRESFELVCKSGKVNARIAGIDPEEYPDLVKLENTTPVTLPLSEMAEALRQVVIACALDQARPILTGVLLMVENEKATLVATDSFRLSERVVPIVPVSEPKTLLMPARTVQEIIRISSTQPTITDWQILIGEEQVICRLGEVEVYSRLLSGAFPNYQSRIPIQFVATVEVTTTELIQALRLSSIFTQSGVSNVLLEVDNEGIFSISSYGSQKGSTVHTVYSLVEDGFTPLKAAFNAKFLIDACQAMGTTNIHLRFSGTTSPLIINSDIPNYLQLVMPIRLDVPA